MEKDIKDFLHEDEELYCVYCGAVLDEESIKKMRISGKCPFCSNDLEEMLCEDEYNKPVNVDDMFVEFKFHIFEETSVVEIKEEIEKLNGKVESIILSKDFLYEISITKEGQRLIDSFNNNKAKLDEFIVTASFILDNKGKAPILSSILTLYPTCVLREEGSNYVICKNKGIAKLVLEQFNYNLSELVAKLMTGYDKYKLIDNFIVYAGPLDLTDAKLEEIFLLWKDNSLLCAKEFDLKGNTIIPGDWIEYLEDLDEIKISCSKSDPGEYYDMSEMLDECLAEASDNESLVICSVRGCEDVLKEEEVK